MLSTALLVVLGAATLPLSVHALSYPVCNRIEEEFTTATPQLTGTWPYYSLLYTCSGELNIEGFSIDACVENGTSCGQAAANAFCQYLGFDSNSPGYYSTTQGTAPAMSMTGEWCVSPGNYENYGHPNRTQFDTIVQQNSGPYCMVLDSVACVRSRTSIASDLASITMKASSAPATAPNAQPSPGSTYIAANTATAGRKMKTVVN